jgi:hypothetical protein
MLVLAWTIGLLVAIAAVCALPWLCRQLVRSLIHHWRSAPPGGSAFNPLQEFIQPQIRHVIEVRHQRLKAESEGVPPDAGASDEP